ncbi:PepSY-associated TM helix domain-containing protein [Ochrobactrum sp. Marseille-Q0166]|uniref:PepSY domain-containing protein n=1 Tax=Ochrobactrum sp. Marseille-Q0166 TaxID=2761105 RepID=UPI001FFFD347|nr:PepSY-associated TM helix domain-containing protein [Ochrobactrum sp. Marseille-Q0166]
MSKPKSHSAEATCVAISSLKAFITRLHFYVGLFVGPFILITVITGTLYVLTPQLEDMIYRDKLRTSSLGTVQPLADQVKAARDFIGDEPRLFSYTAINRPELEFAYYVQRAGLG